jgi:hypothetical protein
MDCSTIAKINVVGKLQGKNIGIGGKYVAKMCCVEP